MPILFSMLYHSYLHTKELTAPHYGKMHFVFDMIVLTYIVFALILSRQKQMTIYVDDKINRIICMWKAVKTAIKKAKSKINEEEEQEHEGN